MSSDNLIRLPTLPVAAEVIYRSADADPHARMSQWQQRKSGLIGGSEGSIVVMASRSPRKPPGASYSVTGLSMPVVTGRY